MHPGARRRILFPAPFLDSIVGDLLVWTNFKKDPEWGSRRAVPSPHSEFFPAFHELCSMAFTQTPSRIANQPFALGGHRAHRCDVSRTVARIRRTGNSCGRDGVAGKGHLPDGPVTPATRAYRLGDRSLPGRRAISGLPNDH